MKKLITLTLFAIAHTAFAEISTPITGTLANGLDYTILPLHQEKGRIEIRLRVNAGGVDENNQQSGVAHMVEHLVFRASDKHPNGVMNHLHQLGFVRAKNYNAITTSDSTTYLMTPPPKAGLDSSLSALSQMMFFAHLNQDDLDKERQIIIEEWRSGQGVSAVMDEQRKAIIRADSRYVRSPVIGTYHSILHTPATQLQNFYQTWYAPNNMNLLIVGDVNVDETKRQISTHFGQAPAKALPERTGDYYEVKLSDRLSIHELHDERSGVSQIAYIVRFDESASRGDTDTARKNRLIDRIALAFITKRLQNEMNVLPNGVHSVVARKSDIGKNTVALGLFSRVDKDKHKDGLQEIFNQRQRLLDHPISQDEFKEYKSDLQTLLDKAYKHTGDRDFAGWVQALVGTTLVDKPYLSQKDIATLTQPLLDNLTAQDVQRRVDEWLSATDRIVQYQAPHSHRVTPISPQDVQAMINLAQHQPSTPPTPKAQIRQIDLPNAPTTAHITRTTRHAHNITEYQLSTGESVLWLKHPSAGDKTYLKAVNTAGTQAGDLVAWQSQLATQLIAQNPPYTFEKAEIDQFKKTHQLSLSFQQNSHQLVIDGNSDTANLDRLINLYHAQLYRTTIKNGLIDTKTALQNELFPTNTRKQLEQTRQQALAHLRQVPLNLPTADELARLDDTQLQQQWQKITHSPTTIYLVNNADPEFMPRFVAKFANPYGKTHAFAPQNTPLAENGVVKFAYHSDPKADIKLWTSTPHQWQGVDAMLIASLKNIAGEKLKLALRDEKLGIYRLNFDTTLNPHSHRIDSQLSFTTSPDKADEMIAHAKNVLSQLPNLITQDDVQKAQSQLITQEKTRQNDPRTWLNRLALSHQANDNFAYLGQLAQPEQHISLEHLQRLANLLYNPNSVQVWVDMPMESDKRP